MKEYEFVRVQIDDHIMSVTINRPEVYNAVHPPLSLELNEIWDNFGKDKDHSGSEVKHLYITNYEL